MPVDEDYQDTLNYPGLVRAADLIGQYVKDAIDYLEVTQHGKQVVANLIANVFRVEHSEMGVEQVAVVR